MQLLNLFNSFRKNIRSPNTNKVPHQHKTKKSFVNLYHIKEANWILEVGILLGIGDDSRLDDVSSTVNIHLRSINSSQVNPFHFSYTPEQHFYTVLSHNWPNTYGHRSNWTIWCIDWFHLRWKKAHAI